MDPRSCQKFPKNPLKLKKPCDSKLFEEMCDLLFEIAEKDEDAQNTKSKYLNKHIVCWIQVKDNTKENSISTAQKADSTGYIQLC